MIFPVSSLTFIFVTISCHLLTFPVICYISQHFATFTAFTTFLNILQFSQHLTFFHHILEHLTTFRNFGNISQLSQHFVIFRNILQLSQYITTSVIFSNISQLLQLSQLSQLLQLLQLSQLYCNSRNISQHTSTS